ncbi:low temperature requirement protein A [Streptomyces sp. NPDC049881]|uniref:low temperature requirement protein A n=1 Tax=Streptomyces sp. NPDC049881 TaxID=3155778 RepID=UPI00343506F5
MTTSTAIPATAPGNGTEARERATWAELFYDLMLVFALTQIAHLVAGHPSWSALGKMLLLLAPLWWGWVGNTLLANTTRETNAHRMLLFGGGLLTFVMAVAAPHALYDARGEAVAYAGAYLALRLLLAVAVHRQGAFPAVNPYSVAVVTAAAMLGAAALPTGPRAAVWAVAVLVELATPVLLGRRLHGLAFGPSHLPERFGLCVIIALGESVLSVGARATEQHLTATLVAVLGLTFAVGASLWWLYFTFAASAVEHALRTHPVPALVVRDVLGYGHFALVTGAAVTAAGLSSTVADPTHVPHSALAASLLPGGAALFTLTFCYTRWRMYGAASVQRLTGGALLVLLAVLAPHLTVLATLAVTAVLLVALNLFENRWIASGRPLLLVPRPRPAAH